jgi:hypothetical protein
MSSDTTPPVFDPDGDPYDITTIASRIYWLTHPCEKPVQDILDSLILIPLWKPDAVTPLLEAGFCDALLTLLRGSSDPEISVCSLSIITTFLFRHSFPLCLTASCHEYPEPD